MQRVLFRRILLDCVPRSHGPSGKIRQRAWQVLRDQLVCPIHPRVLQGPHDGGSSIRKCGKLVSHVSTRVTRLLGGTNDKKTSPRNEGLDSVACLGATMLADETSSIPAE